MSALASIPSSASRLARKTLRASAVDSTRCAPALTHCHWGPSGLQMEACRTTCPRYGIIVVKELWPSYHPAPACADKNKWYFHHSVNKWQSKSTCQNSSSKSNLKSSLVRTVNYGHAFLHDRHVSLFRSSVHRFSVQNLQAVLSPSPPPLLYIFLEIDAVYTILTYPAFCSPSISSRPQLSFLVQFCSVPSSPSLPSLQAPQDIMHFSHKN